MKAVVGLVGLGAMGSGMAQSLRRRDPALCQEVFLDDKALDRLEVEIDERCVRLLALQQPLAGDLRFITAALKVVNDLERIGDHAVNIAGSAQRLIQEPELKPLVDIPRMADLAAGMLRDALDAFVRRDTGLARALCRRSNRLKQARRRLAVQRPRRR